MKPILLLCLFLATIAATCQPIPRPTPGPTKETPTPASTELPAPTERPTQKPTPEPPPVELQQLTSGKAVVQIDLTNFELPPPGPNGQLDYFAASTFMWDENDRTAPALELSVRGTVNVLCLRMPCESAKNKPQPLGIVARFSGDIKHDGQEPDEHRHCGSGIAYSRRLAIGPDRLFSVLVS